MLPQKHLLFGPDLRHSAARLRGFETDLGLQGQQYNTILSILYVRSHIESLVFSD